MFGGDRPKLNERTEHFAAADVHSCALRRGRLVVLALALFLLLCARGRGGVGEAQFRDVLEGVDGLLAAIFADEARTEPAGGVVA